MEKPFSYSDAIKSNKQDKLNQLEKNFHDVEILLKSLKNVESVTVSIEKPKTDKIVINSNNNKINNKKDDIINYNIIVIRKNNHDNILFQYNIYNNSWVIQHEKSSINKKIYLKTECLLNSFFINEIGIEKYFKELDDNKINIIIKAYDEITKQINFNPLLEFIPYKCDDNPKSLSVRYKDQYNFILLLDSNELTWKITFYPFSFIKDKIPFNKLLQRDNIIKIFQQIINSYDDYEYGE